MPSRRAVVLAGLSVAVTGARAALAQSPPLARIAAAADARTAVDEIVALFQARWTAVVTVTYGSTGNLARQIEQGAPFELLLAADESYARHLASNGLSEGAGHVYARGQLAVIARTDEGPAVDPLLDGLRRALVDGSVRRLAIANPEHAPYGRAAMAAIERTGLADLARSRLVHGENVAQAAQMVVAGGAEAGIVAYSLAGSPQARARLRSATIDHALAPPLIQRAALTRRAGATARALYELILGAEGQAIFARHGFLPP